MLRIYLPSSTDLKLCSDVPIIDFVNTWTFICHRIYVSNPYLRPGTWVLTSGSLQMGLKWFVNLWDTGNWSKMICQPLGHLLGPGSRVQSYGSGQCLTWFSCALFHGTQEPRPRTQIPRPRTQIIGPGTRKTYMLRKKNKSKNGLCSGKKGYLNIQIIQYSP